MYVNPVREHELLTTRRQLFGRSALGVGTAAVAQLLGNDITSSEAGRVQAANTGFGMHHLPAPDE